MSDDASPESTSTSVAGTSAAGWRAQSRPAQLLCRQDFSAYGITRQFLDLLAKWSEESGIYPDLSFGTTYVNITLPLADEGPQAEDWRVARDINALAEQARS
jgi:4a-hydroxytetrahydrobiopterin dehydratase